MVIKTQVKNFSSSYIQSTASTEDSKKYEERNVKWQNGNGLSLYLQATVIIQSRKESRMSRIFIGRLIFLTQKHYNVRLLWSRHILEDQR